MQEMKVLTTEQVEQVGGGDTFGYWVGKLSVWANPVTLAADIASGGQLSNAAGQGMSAVEDWVNGK